MLKCYTNEQVNVFCERAYKEGAELERASIISLLKGDNAYQLLSYLAYGDGGMSIEEIVSDLITLIEGDNK
jgi:hypothetical protein